MLLLNADLGVPDPSPALAATVFAIGVAGFYINKLVRGKQAIPWNMRFKRKKKKRHPRSEKGHRSEGHLYERHAAEEIAAAPALEKTRHRRVRVWRLVLSREKAQQLGLGGGPTFFDPRLDKTFHFDPQLGAYAALTSRERAAAAAEALLGCSVTRERENLPPMPAWEHDKAHYGEGESIPAPLPGPAPEWGDDDNDKPAGSSVHVPDWGDDASDLFRAKPAALASEAIAPLGAPAPDKRLESELETMRSRYDELRKQLEDLSSRLPDKK
jgi:hypothetical protein